MNKEVTIKELLEGTKTDLQQLLKGAMLITIKDVDNGESTNVKIQGIGKFGKQSIMNVLVSMIEMLDFKIENPRGPIEAFTLLKMIDAMITAYHDVLELIRKDNIQDPDSLVEVLEKKRGDVVKQARKQVEEDEEEKVETSKEDKHDA